LGIPQKEPPIWTWINDHPGDHPDAAGEIPVDGEELKRRCADSGVDAQTETIWEVLRGRWGIFRGLTCLT